VGRAQSRWKLSEGDDDLMRATDLAAVSGAGDPMTDARRSGGDRDGDGRAVTGDLPTFVAAELPLDPRHERNGAPIRCSPISPRLRELSRGADHPDRDRRFAEQRLDVLDDLRDLHDFDCRRRLAPSRRRRGRWPTARAAMPPQRRSPDGGNDGATACHGLCGETPPPTARAAWSPFEALEDISIVAAAGPNGDENARSRARSSPI
jgi:hypothetical protein